MAVLIFLFLVFGEAWVRISGSNYDQCCYLYGSVQRNERNCVPEGSVFSLNGIVYNPHDRYTNLTVRWFKANSPPATGTSATRPEIIPDNHSDYNFSIYNAMTSSSRSCTDGPLYHDTFTLLILNFTTDKNGYYWYQIFINGSSYQPSQYAQFYADYGLCIQNQSHFKHTNEIQCPSATYFMTSPPAMTTTFPINVTKGLISTAPKITESGSNPDYANATYSITSPLAMIATIAINATMVSTAAPKMTETGSINIPIYYVIGALTVFIILFITLAIVILVIVILKRYSKHRQKTEQSKPSPPVHENTEPVSTPSLESAICNQILLHTSDSREDDTYSIVSDKNIDPQQDHTYDAVQFNNQNSNNEQPHYNTLQRENAANIPIWSKSSKILNTYEKIGVNNTTNGAHNCANVCQLRVTCRTDSESEYDVVEDGHTHNVLNQPSIGVNGTNKMIPQDYEPVYCYGSSNTQTTELAGKQMLFDESDETYGAHRTAVQLRVDGGEDKPNSKTVKEETPIANKEVQYAEPLTPNDKNHIIQDAQAEGEHFYHSLELNEQINAEKYISGHTMDEGGATNAPKPFNFDHCEFDDPMYKGIPHIMVPKQTNNTLSKMYHDKIAFPDEVSCTGDVNVHPDMLSLEEDNNTPGYSDPDWLDDTNISNGQKDTRFRVDRYV